VNDQPFTVIVCQAAPCDRNRELGLMERLGEVVRGCPHTVLIRAGCLMRATRCRAHSAHDCGTYLLVQPCDRDRRPSRPLIAVGPVLTRADTEAVASWLEHQPLDSRLLAPRLRPKAARRPA
jgi:hypothetical protein